MARKKVRVDLVPVSSPDQADRHLAEIAEHQRIIDRQTVQLNEQIDRLKAEYAEALQPSRDYIARLEAGLNAWAETNKDALFGKARSLELDYGRLGYRKSTTLKTLPKVTWKAVLEALKRRKDKDGLRVKEEVDKEALREWEDGRLAKLGVERVTEDHFFYEVKEEVLAGSTEARAQ